MGRDNPDAAIRGWRRQTAAGRSPVFRDSQSSDEPSEQADALSTTFTEFDLMAGQTAQSGQSFPG